MGRDTINLLDMFRFIKEKLEKMKVFLWRIVEAILCRPHRYLTLYGTYTVVAVLVILIFVYSRPDLWHFIFLILIAAFLLFEIGFRTLLRIFYGPEYRYAIFVYFRINDPVYGTVLRPNAHSKKIPFRIFDSILFPYRSNRTINLEENIKKRNLFTINSLGFRGREFSPNKKNGRLRIFCVGGSTTVCDGNDDDEAWPVVLEKNLKSRGYDCEVINAGVSSRSSYKNYLRISREISNLDPDVILLYEGLNEENAYSELGLGKGWKSNVVRSLSEEMLWCEPNKPFITSDRFLSKFLLIRALRRKLFLGGRWLNYESPFRWRRVLSNPVFYKGLYDNLIEDAKIAHEKNILLYTIDFPTLVYMDESPEERIISRKRAVLSPLTADYDAVLKAGIDETLALTKPIIPNLPIQKDFARYRGDNRTPLFRDSIHTTPQGNAIIGEAVCERILADQAFLDRYNGISKKSNVCLDPELIEKGRAKAGKNSPELQHFIENVIRRLEQTKNRFSEDGVPRDRYTTF